MKWEDIKEFEVYEVENGYSLFGSSWCFHNIFIAKISNGNEIILCDTYPSKVITKQLYENKNIKLIKLFDDFRELRNSDKYESDFYLKKDVLFVPIGMGSERYYLKKDAIINENRIKNIVDKEIENYNYQIKSSQNSLNKLKEIQNNNYKINKYYEIPRL